MTTATRWWYPRGDQIVCELCPRECALHEGQRGFCFVRQNVGGTMQLTTYGRSSGFCVDPIEKKPLNHFLPGTPVFSFGTEGCNLGCKFCQNWSISKAREVAQLADAASPDAIARAALEAGCRSVAFTYNDPVIWAEYAIDAAHACHAAGLKTVAVTAGYISPAARREFFSVMDAANVDLKGFSEDFYQHLTLSKLEPVLDTLRWLKHESNVWFEITNLMIPGENDSADETAKMCDWIVKHLGSEVPVHFTAFHPDFRLREHPPTPPETLCRARRQALAAGVKFAYVGNVHDVEGQSTWCPACGQLLIERDWYELGAYHLEGNRCGRCGATISGVFDAQPGRWGRKRLPVRITPATVKLIDLDRAPGAPATTPQSVPAMTLSVQRHDSQDSSVAASGEAALQPPGSPPVGAPVALPQSPLVEFSDDEAAQIIAYARSMVESVLRGEAAPQLSPSLAVAPAYGAYVTLRRSGLLRACRGRFGGVGPLLEVLGSAACDTATSDPRFPTIVRAELPWLSVEVSLMYAPTIVAAEGEERLQSVVVGRHGLVINHPRGRGLLLPQVATEAGWNAITFLENVCLKAGLPRTAWREPESQLMTFQARILHSPAPQAEFDSARLTPELMDCLADHATRILKNEPLDGGGAPEPLVETCDDEVGVAVQTDWGRFAATIAGGQSLAALAVAGARSLKQSLREPLPGPEQIARVVVLWRPIPLLPKDFPDRFRTLQGVAIAARSPGRTSIFIAPPDSSGPEAVLAALQSVGADLGQWQTSSGAISLVAFSVCQHQRLEIRTPPEIRRPAVAGQFYPSSPQEAGAVISACLAEVASMPAVCRAVMLPHAGWPWCGSVIGRTLARTVVPRRVIIVGPKHTRAGANWSVSSAASWDIHGAPIPVLADMRGRLLALLPAMRAEPEAHRAEHGIEVLLPFLRHLNPELQILPIVVGPTPFPQTQFLGRALSILVAESPEPVLLVISSDMHHFAPEVENRRRDFLALDALRTGDAGRLFDTVCAHEISMCGVIPAIAVMRALAEQGPIQPELVHYATSADAGGDRNRVVGYAGVVIR